MPRLQQTLVLGLLIARSYHKHVRIFGLKPNKDLAYVDWPFEAGEVQAVIDGPHKRTDLTAVFRLFGTGDRKGTIIVTMA